MLILVIWDEILFNYFAIWGLNGLSESIQNTQEMLQWALHVPHSTVSYERIFRSIFLTYSKEQEKKFSVKGWRIAIDAFIYIHESNYQKHMQNPHLLLYKDLQVTFKYYQGDYLKTNRQD